MQWRGSVESKSVLADGDPKQLPAFRRFQVQYLAVYLTVMLADWLQGTNMYTLYQSYNMDIGALFLTGFSSAAVFGTFTGVLGRAGARAWCDSRSLALALPPSSPAMVNTSPPPPRPGLVCAAMHRAQREVWR